MNIKDYGKIVCDYIDSLNDDAFDNLLLEAGIEKCPIQIENVRENYEVNFFEVGKVDASILRSIEIKTTESWVVDKSYSQSFKYTQSSLYITTNNMIISNNKVA